MSSKLVSPRIKHIASAFSSEFPQLSARGIYLLACIDEFYIIGFCFSASSRGPEYRYVHTVFDCMTCGTDPDVIHLSFGSRIRVGDEELHNVCEKSLTFDETASQLLESARQFMDTVATGELCHKYLFNISNGVADMAWLEATIASCLWQGLKSEADTLFHSLEMLRTSFHVDSLLEYDGGDAASLVELELQRNKLLLDCIERSSRRLSEWQSGDARSVRKYLKDEIVSRLAALKL